MTKLFFALALLFSVKSFAQTNPSIGDQVLTAQSLESAAGKLGSDGFTIYTQALNAFSQNQFSSAKTLAEQANDLLTIAADYSTRAGLLYDGIAAQMGDPNYRSRADYSYAYSQMLYKQQLIIQDLIGRCRLEIGGDYWNNLP